MFEIKICVFFYNNIISELKFFRRYNVLDKKLKNLLKNYNIFKIKHFFAISLK